MQQNNIKIELMAVGQLQVNCSIIYSIESKNAVIIDAGNHKDQIISFLKERGLKVLKLIHTHAHFDHIGASSLIKDETGAEISLHKDDASLYAGLSEQGRMFGLNTPTPTTPDVLFEEGYKFAKTNTDLDEFLESLKIYHTPGHSEGSVSIFTEFFETPIVFAGDTLFAGSIGRTDLPGGSFEILEKSIKEKLYTLPENTIVITGHGPDTSIKSEKHNNPFVRP